MREIKFRAWDARKNEWLSADEIMERVLVNPSWEGKTFQLDEKHEKGFAKNIGYSFELMQYTNLNDKNGKEIYEGDIAKHIEPENEDGPYSEEIGTVEYDQGTYILKTLVGSMTTKWLICNPSNNEVIGNIYENPELLEVTP